MNIDQIPLHVLRDVKERGFTDEQIKRMSAHEVFNQWLLWNGIIGWSTVIWDVVERLKKAEDNGS